MDKVDLLKRADELLAFIIEGLQQGKELAEREAPLVVREVIQWGIVEHAILAGVGLLGLLFGSWLFLWSRQQYYLEKKEKCVVWCWRRLSDYDVLFGDRHRGDVTHHGDQCGLYGEGYRGAAAVSAGRIEAIVEISRLR